MKHFKTLDFSILDLYSEHQKMLDENIINYKNDNQICMTTIPEKPDDIYFGKHSLWFDWTKKYEEIDEYGNKKITVPKKDILYNEEDFTHLCDRFKDTLFEKVYNELNAAYKLGRVRFMKTQPKSCFSWHRDSSSRIHYPLKTQDGCFMVIENEVVHMPKHTWWWTNTEEYHTAVNSSSEERIHVVFTVLSKK
jgi:hypothetical protein